MLNPQAAGTFKTQKRLGLHGGSTGLRGMQDMGRMRSSAQPSNVTAHGSRNQQAAMLNRSRRRSPRHSRPASGASYGQQTLLPVGPLAYLALHVATTRKGL